MSIFKRKPKQEEQEKRKARYIQDIQARYEHSVMLAEHKRDKEEIAYSDAYQHRVNGASEVYGKALFDAAMTGIDYDSFLAKAANVIPILESRLRREYVDSVTATREECRKAIEEAEAKRDDRLDELEAEEERQNESSSIDR